MSAKGKKAKFHRWFEADHSYDKNQRLLDMNDLYFKEVESEINENDILTLDELVQIDYIRVPENHREPLYLVGSDGRVGMYVRFIEIVDDMVSFETFGSEIPMIMSASTYGIFWSVRRVEKG